MIPRITICAGSLLAFTGSLWIWFVAAPAWICMAWYCPYYGPPAVHVISLLGAEILCALSLIPILTAILPRVWFIGMAAAIELLLTDLYFETLQFTTFNGGSSGAFWGSLAILLGGSLVVAFSLRIRRARVLSLKLPRATPLPQ